MSNIHLFAIVSLLLGCICFFAFKYAKQRKFSGLIVFSLLLAGLVLRIIIAINQTGFSYDIQAFSAWADRMYQVGPSKFYSPDVFTDYPPLYMLVLYLVGLLRSVFQIEHFSNLHILLLKIPAIICDLVCSYLIYSEANKHFSQSRALVLMSTYLFLPAIILNSSAWGQIDATHTLIVILMCLLLKDTKMIPAYIVYAIGVLLKPQTLIFTPLLLVGIWDQVFLNGFQKKNFYQNLLGGLAVILGMIVFCLPFGIDSVFKQYLKTLSSYPYASANAYNFWSLIGMNWSDQNTKFLFFSAKTWGSIVIVLIVVFVFLLSRYLKNNQAKYFILGVFITFTMFVFSVRMHERYVYPALALLLFAFIYKPTKALWVCFTGLAVLHYYNAAHVLYFYDPANYNSRVPIILLVSAGMFLLFFYFLYAFNRYLAEENGLKFALMKNSQEKDSKLINRLKRFLFKPSAPIPSSPKVSFSKLDLILLLAIMIVYSSFALYDLGDQKAPLTRYEMQQDDSIVLQFPEDAQPQILSYYIAPPHDISFTLETGQATEDDWNYTEQIIWQNVFSWSNTSLPEKVRFAKLTLHSLNASVIELTFLDDKGNVVLPENASEYKTLFDESSLHPQVASFRNSMYFDEIYHARTAYEYLHGLPTYEYTHPPMGKIFISLGIALFGMNPFGWRIIGTLFGIFMLPFLYLFGKRITKSTTAAALSCWLFAFDFMHFVQTRIATIDVYVTFFIIVMYYFMYKYCTLSFYDQGLRKTFIPLGICGIAMGFAIACKWTGIYAAAGLSILFFANLLKRYKEYLYAKASPQGRTGTISHDKILKNFLPYNVKTIGFCLIFFIVIPLAIYLLSYLPFVDPVNPGLLNKAVANQTNMFNYHSMLDVEHSFSSLWFEWPIMIRPVWFYSRVVSNTLREGISTFGNPLIWWIGVPAFIYQLYLLFRRSKSSLARNSTGLKNHLRKSTTDLTHEELYSTSFLTIGYLAVYLPWVFVSRLTFIYHYFPSVPFAILLIIQSLMQWKKRVAKRTFLIGTCIYAVLVFGLFILFYPILAGTPVEQSFVIKYLRWLPDWIFVAN